MSLSKESPDSAVGGGAPAAGASGGPASARRADERVAVALRLEDPPSRGAPAKAGRPPEGRGPARRVAGPALAGLVCLLWACGGSPEGGSAGAGEGAASAADADRVVERIRSVVDSAGHEVAVYYRPLAGGDSILLNPDVRMHAASTMKVPVMMQIYLDRDSGRISLDDAMEVRTAFRSIADSSTYRLTPESDSDTALYRLEGEEVPVRDLMRRMITVSSNLATNILIEEVGAERVTGTLRRLGADSMEVLRGVEDIPAYRAGLSNTTTARDLGIVFEAIGNRRGGRPGCWRSSPGRSTTTRFPPGSPTTSGWPTRPAGSPASATTQGSSFRPTPVPTSW